MAPMALLPLQVMLKSMASSLTCWFMATYKSQAFAWCPYSHGRDDTHEGYVQGPHLWPADHVPVASSAFSLECVRFIDS